ncbi:MAG: four helix bundle protein [Desulfobacterales bacterium]|nr:MAG: four helix bundle protein [Desulfobacterales bacterium]
MKSYKDLEIYQFLTYAHASCDETILHLNFINDTHKLNKEEINYYFEKYDELGRKINKYIQYVESEWKSCK